MDKPAREPSIPWGMKKACMAITIQSFLFGYLLACFNACLATGDNNSGSDCFEDKDSSCPQGTVYNDLDLTPGKTLQPLPFTISPMPLQRKPLSSLE